MRIRKAIAGLFSATLIVWGTIAFAVQPLEITDAFAQVVEPHDQIDDAHEHLIVTGVNFANGGNIELTLGGFDLVVIFQDDARVVAELPPITFLGSYQLVATTGGGTVRHDDFDGVTFGMQGETGPQGPEGPIGPAGADGVDGTNGLPGTDGDPGADGATGPAGPQGVPGIQGEQGPPGQDGGPGAPGADGTSCTVADNQDGSATIACNDNTFATVYDGQDGADGLPGEPGPQGDQGPPGEPGSAGAADFAYVLETVGGQFAVSRDLRPELDTFCGDVDGCSIRLATGFRDTTVSTGASSELNYYIEKFEFMIGVTRERSGTLQTRYTIEGTQINLWDDYWVSGFSSRDGDGVVYELSNSDFGICIFSDVDPGATGFSDRPDQALGMTLHAFGEDNTECCDTVTDAVCRLWIFD